MGILRVMLRGCWAVSLRTLASALLVVAVACSAEQVPQAELLGSPVTGYLLVVPGGATRVCEDLAGSPPQACQGQAMVITGLDLEEINGLQASGDTRWSSVPVMLYGDPADGQLDVPVLVRGSAVFGRATAAPTCPELRDPPDPSCAPMSVADAPMVIRHEDGTVVTTVVTDATGSFAVALTPGRYRVEPGLVDAFVDQAPPVAVTVEEAPVAIDVMYDTGVR